jgi:transcriptional regulator with XRE-family HTH domain
MNITAKDLQDFCLASISAIMAFPDRNETSVYKELAEESGLSVSLIRQFHKGDRNLTTDSLDRLVASVKQSMRKAAA